MPTPSTRPTLAASSPPKARTHTQNDDKGSFTQIHSVFKIELSAVEGCIHLGEGGHPILNMVSSHESPQVQILKDPDPLARLKGRPPCSPPLPELSPHRLPGNTEGRVPPACLPPSDASATTEQFNSNPLSEQATSILLCSFYHLGVHTVEKQKSYIVCSLLQLNVF